MTCLIFQSLRFATHFSSAFRFVSSKKTLDDMKAQNDVELVVAVSPEGNIMYMLCITTFLVCNT
jgi:hypothetical protein